MSNEKQAAYWVKVEPATAAWLDHHGLMEAHRDRSGQAVPNPLHVPDRKIRDVVGLPTFARYKELEPASVPVKLTVEPRTRISESAKQVSVGASVRIIGASGDLGVFGDVESNHGATKLADGKNDGLVGFLVEPLMDSLDEGLRKCWRGVDRVMPVDLDVHIEISPSVGGASKDASVGTPESTEGDQTPDVGEKKKHPAAVTAGCGETKTNR